MTNHRSVFDEDFPVSEGIGRLWVFIDAYSPIEKQGFITILSTIDREDWSK